MHQSRRATMQRYIDPTVEHVGISKLRQLNASNLRNFDKMLVVQDNNTPLVVVQNYHEYLETQEKLEKALETIRMFKSGGPGVLEGLQDAKAGRLTPLDDIDPDL